MKKGTRTSLKTRTKAPRARVRGVRVSSSLSLSYPVPSVLISFGRFCARLSALVLVLSFVATPIADVFAAEDSVTAATVTDQTSSLVVSTDPAPTLDTPVEPSQSVTADPAPVADATTLVPEVVAPVSEATTTPEVPPVSVPTESTLLGDQTPSAATSTESVVEPVLTDVPSPEVPTPDVSTSTEVVTEVVDADVAPTTTDATTTEPTASTTLDTTPTTTVPVDIHISDLNRYSFSSTECVPVGDGAFHCVKHDVNAQSVVPAGHSIGEVFASPDAGGDMEIFTVADDGAQIQITNNIEDDSSPSKDEERGDIVWHTLLNDRYQIMYFEKASGVTKELTHERYNNMEPSVHDGVIVWQAWIDNDAGGGWEIMVYEDGTVEQLTHNTAQDILPSIDADYISWQSDEGGEWSAKIYNRKTHHIDTVRGVEGGKVQNPRMVLLFDTTRDNGDRETVGYDPLKKETVTLGSQPARPIPQDAPIPAPEKNDKALIVTQQTPKIETRASSTPDGTGSNADATSTPPVADPAVDAATTTPEIVIDMSSPTTTEAVLVPALPDTSAIEDLVIPAFESASTSTST